MNVVATPATRSIARHILAETAWDGAEAVLRHLPDVRECQIPALIALLAKAAVTGERPAGTVGPPRKAILLDEEERRRAHRRYGAGARDAATVRGEQEYQRERRRVQRERKVAA